MDDTVTIPLYTFVRGDCLGLILLVDDAHSMTEVALRAQRAAGMRVAPAARVGVYRNDLRLDPKMTVADAGLRPLDRIDILPEPSDAVY